MAEWLMRLGFIARFAVVMRVEHRGDTRPIAE